jgi:hypothetical protein
VPSLVFSEGSCCESGLEDLEEVEEQAEEEQEARGGSDGKDERDVWWKVKTEQKVGSVGVVPSILDAV